MKDPHPDDTAPLAPRRSLAGPATATSGATGRPAPLVDERTRPLAPAPGASVARPTGGPPNGSGPATASSSRIGAAGAPDAAGTRSTAGAGASLGAGRARRARLRIVRVDPWSVMKMAFALSIALAVVMIVAVAVVWAVLGTAGVWDSINSTVASSEILTNGDTFDVNNYIGVGRVLGLTLIVAVADVVLLTAIATLGAFLYNLAAALLGGLEVTLAETH